MPIFQITFINGTTLIGYALSLEQIENTVLYVERVKLAPVQQEIEQFLADFSQWVDSPIQPKGENCDQELYLYSLCCPAHKKDLQTWKRLCLIAHDITTRHPILRFRPLSPEWFVQLSKLSGLSIPSNIFVRSKP